MTPTLGLLTPDAEVRRELDPVLSALEGVRVVPLSDARAVPTGCSCILAWLGPGVTQAQLTALRERCQGVRLMLVVDRADVAQAVNAVHCGAFDFILRPYRKHELVAGILFALGIDGPVDVDVDAARVGFESLTEREREIVDLMMSGQCQDTIAERLGLLPKTVAIHEARVLEKMKTPTLAALARTIKALETSPA